MKELISMDKHWYAIRTRFKCEKRVVEDLSKRGIESYVPLIAKTKRYTRKVKTYRVPLIYTYAFVHIGREDYVRVLDHSQVVDYIRFGRSIVPIPEEEIHTLRQVCGEFEGEILAEELGTTPLHPGDDVELIYGQLSGLKGRLEERHGKREFVVSLRHIGYRLRIVADRHMLRRVSAQA
jgi:transcription antitermination factor NusG